MRLKVLVLVLKDLDLGGQVLDLDFASQVLGLTPSLALQYANWTNET